MGLSYSFGTPSSLYQRTSALTSAATPVVNVNYFRSGEGSPVIPDNDTTQTDAITWQIEGIYYDENRRRVHQLDRQHSSLVLEHAYLDESANTWSAVDTDLADGNPAGHWRACDFDPQTGRLYWQREGTDDLYIYDPVAGWSIEDGSSVLTANSNPGNLGFHPNLFGAGSPGILTGSYVGDGGFVAYRISDDTWHDLNQSGEPSANLFACLYAGWSIYVPATDELLMCQSAGDVFAFAAGAGLETNLSTSNSASARNAAPKGFENPGGGSGNFLYACTHPRQPSVVLAFDAANSNVYYTDDAAATAWQTASFTHPFASELNTGGEYTVGSLPYHGVVAACESGVSNNANFVYWRPPLV